MMNVLDGLLGGASNYMHLVPTTPAPIEWLLQQQDDDQEAEPASWMDAAVDTMRGCHRGVSDWYYGEQEPRDVVFVEEVELVQDGQGQAQVASGPEQADVMMLDMAAIMLSVALCGVVYAAYRCLVDSRKKVWRAEDDVAMHEPDAF